MKQFSLFASGKRSGRLLPVLALLAGSLAAQAQNFNALPVTGYNADVVANGTNINAYQTVTAAFDNPASEINDALTTGQNASVLMELGYSNADGGGGGGGGGERSYSNTAGSTATVGLPQSRLINSALTSGLSFQLASYSGTNSLHLKNGSTGMLTLIQPQMLNTLYVLAAAGNGSSSMDVTVKFSDGSTQFFGSNSVSDWFNGSNYAISGVGRVDIRNNEIDNNNSNPRLYELPLPLSSTNQTKTVTSILFANNDDGVLCTTPQKLDSLAGLVK